MYRDNSKYRKLTVPCIRYPNLKSKYPTLSDNDIGYLGIASLVVDMGNEFAVAKLLYDEHDDESLPHHYKRPFSIDFSYAGKTIYETDVIFFSFYRLCDEDNRVGEKKRFAKQYLPGTIFEPKDLEDFYLFIYKPSSDRKYRKRFLDLIVYHSFNRTHELNYVSKEMIQQTIFTDTFWYIGGFRDKRQFIIDGKRYDEDELDLSFVEWEYLFNVSNNSFCRPSNMFDSSNPPDKKINELQWNSNYIADWKCVFNHKWKSSLNDITKLVGYNACPVCRRYSIPSPGTTEESAKNKIDIILGIIAAEGTNDFETIIKDADNKLVKLKRRIGNIKTPEKLWKGLDSIPEIINYYFLWERWNLWKGIYGDPIH